MDRIELLDKVESLFDKAGFHLSKRCCVRPSCFDFAARKSKQLTFIKVHPNIGNISSRDAKGLKTLGNFFEGTSLFVCEKTRSRVLENDTLYSRYSVGAITNKTLEDALIEGNGPLVEAGPGGYYVKLDGEAIQRRRLERGLSIGRMADVMGVSRRSIYGYERGMAKASVPTAYKLEWVLGIPVAKQIDISECLKEPEGFIATARRIFSESRFLQSVMKKLLQFDFSVFPMSKAPFDFIARCPEKKTKILGTVACDDEPSLAIRTEEIVSVSKIVEAQPIIVTDSSDLLVDNVPLVRQKELENVKCAEELMSIL